MRDIKQAVIFAGGLGTRLKPFTESSPKPMFKINNKPFLEYLICQIAQWGIKDIILLLGYLPAQIMDYFTDGSKWGVHIRYVVTPVKFNTQFRLKEAEPLLNDAFLMMYCDNICPIDFNQLVADYYKNNALIQITAYANDDHYTKDNMIINSDGAVLLYDKSRKAADLKGVDIGYAIVSKEVMSLMSNRNDNFETVVYPKLVKDRRLFSTITKHRYYSIGSFDRIDLTKKYLSEQKYIFLDRDGVINKRPLQAEYVRNPDDFIWLPGAKNAIKKLNNAGYFIILISNQAGIARGLLTVDDLHAIQDKMQADLAAIGAHIDATYYCPHGWDDNCDCRKPKPGLLYKAQKDYSINLTKCLMIGDDERDIMTAHNANMKGILVTDSYSLIDAVNDLLNGEISN